MERLGPAVQISWNAPNDLHVHAGGAITVIRQYLAGTLLTGSPVRVLPARQRITARRGRYGFQITPMSARKPIRQGQNVFRGQSESRPAYTHGR